MRNKYTKEDFELAVKTSNSVREILIKLNLQPKGGNYKTFYVSAKKFNVDVSAFINPTTYGVDKEKRDCITDALITFAVKNSISYKGTLHVFGLEETGANNRWIRSKIKKLNLNIDHFKGQGYLKNKSHNWAKKMPLSKILVKNSSYSSSHALKLRLIKDKLIINECSRCHIDSWEGEKISLHLDHINGDNSDNRIENLRLLCPNCHSLTDTYCGKNARK